MIRRACRVTLALAIMVFALCVSVWPGSPHSAYGDGGGPAAQPSTPPGGGAIPDRTVPVLTPAEQAVVEKKVSAQRAFLAQQSASNAQGGNRGASPGYQSGSWYYSNNYVLKPEPNVDDNWGWNWSAGWYFNATHTSSTSSGSIGWPPPNYNNDNGFYFYMCGPGSTTFTARSWASTAVSNYSNSTGDGEGLHSTDSAGAQVYGWGWGWYGYLYEAAYWEMGYSSQYGWGTTWQSLKSFINNNDNNANTFIDDPYDEGGGTLTQSDFNGDASFDLEQYGGAIIAEVSTDSMPEWSTNSNADHFVPVNGWNTSNSYVNWVDTAYQSGRSFENNGGNTFGNYNDPAYVIYDAIMGSYSSHDDLW
ncbi:MAG TPA: hypothetical protein VFB58_04920 [Chloroflexota bacterium]|nr:hypothetical protein [Chloroflexota bacterium]